MADARMMAQMTGKEGFIAALDQSGGSTPGALRLYGIAESDYDGEAAMFRLMHEMRVRIMTAPAFTGEKVIGVSGILLLVFILLRSAAIAVRNGGIRWRDTFYPLEELRENRL